MPTIKDIAERAGVSHGTVSNVLNKRGNVSAEKIQQVEKAAHELGYTINAQAKQLRQGHSQKVCVIVPRAEIRQYRDLFTGILGELKNSDYEVNVYFSNDLPYEEEKLLEQIAMMKPAAVVLVSSLIKNPGMFHGDTLFVFVERKVKNLPETALFVGFDYQEAGRALADRSIQDGRHNLAVFCGNETYAHTKAFLKGIRESLEEEDCRYTVFQSLDAFNLNIAFEMKHSEEQFDAVIADSVERAELVRNVYQYSGGGNRPEIYALSNKELRLYDHLHRYELNYKQCGRNIAKYILKTERDEKIPAGLLSMENDGFTEVEEPFSGKERTRINFLALISPTSQAMKYLIPEFTRLTGIEVNMIEVTYDELYKCISNMVNSGNVPYDLIRLDMVWLSRFAERLLAPLPMEQEPFVSIRNNLSDVFKEEYFKVNGTNYVLPLDPSVQILYYRKDLFEDALISREFYETHRRHLRVPRSYKEYNEVAEFFTKKYNKNSRTKYGISLAYGTAAVAACDFLPRLKEAGESLIDANGRITIETEPVMKVLSEYIAASEYTDKNMYQWWSKVIDMFADGNTAMNIVFSNHAPSMVLNHNSAVAGKVGFAAVPGHKPLLGGGVVGISKDTRKQAACESFLQWVYSEKIASAITSLGGYINHKKLVDNQDILEVYPWIEGMEKAFAIGSRRYTGCVNPQFDESVLEEILGEAIRSAVLGVQTVGQALKEAQNKCDDRFGQKQ